MAEEKKVKVTFKENVTGGTVEHPIIFKENQSVDLTEDHFNHLKNAGIKVELVKDLK